MKILVHNGPREQRFHRRGLVSAFERAGDQVLVWDPKAKPAFDAFDEFSPDIYCGSRADHPRAVVRCLDEYHPKVVVMEDILPARDMVNFAPVAPRPEWKSDVAFLGDCTPEALKWARILIEEGNAVKICGDDPSWPFPEYLGPIADESVPAFYASATRVMTLLDPEVAIQAILVGSKPLEKVPTHAGTYADRIASLYREWGIS